MAVVIKAYREGLTLAETHTYGTSVTEFWMGGRQLAQPPGDFNIQQWSAVAAHAVRYGWIPLIPFMVNNGFETRVRDPAGDLHQQWVDWKAANPPENDPPLVLDPGAQLIT